MFDPQRIRSVLQVTFAAAAILLGGVLQVSSQKEEKPEGGSIVFAVLDDGKSIEPIGIIKNGKMAEVVTDNSDADLKAINSYLSSGKSYSIVFGGSKDGTVNVVSKNQGDCAGLSAEVNSKPVRAKLKGFVMALATDLLVKDRTAVRRLPTKTERAEIEKLVRAEFIKQKVPAAAAQKLQYHNLTAIDLDSDGRIEFIGTFWVESKKAERSTLFFIVESSQEGPLRIELGEFNKYGPDEVMSGEMKHLDEGIYHNLLLDYFDIDGDGVDEIFTTAQAFEGRNFQVYKKEGGRWKKSFDSYNYRCGF
jgi:hypothetical protein